MAAGLVDSHCHLDFIEGGAEGALVTAQRAGLVAIINPGTSLESSRAAVALAERHPMVYAAVGVHPHDASTFDSRISAALRELASHPKVVAIGEIGLDYHRNYSPRDAQQRAYEAQLELAAELDLPVIIHNRDATEDTFARLREWAAGGNGRQGVLHSYSAGAEWLEQAAEMGLFIGISGPVTYPKAEQLQRVAREVPLDRLLVETDAPFLTPAPFRGRQNEPAFVQYVAGKVAALREVPVEQVGRQTTQNVIRLFGRIGTILE